MRFQVLRDLIAVHFWKSYIEKDEVRYEVSLFLERADSFDAVGITYGGDPFTLEAYFDDFAHCC